MAPSFAQLDPGDCALPNSMGTRDIPLRLPSGKSSFDVRRLLISKPRGTTSFAACYRAASDLIRFVFLCGLPKKVVGSVVRFYPIIMGGLMVWCWPRAMERRAYNYGKSLRDCDLVVYGSDEKIATPVGKWSEKASRRDAYLSRTVLGVDPIGRFVASDAPETANVVVGEVFHDTPFLGSVFFSHLARFLGACGQRWQPVTSGLAISLFYTCSISTSTAQLLTAGAGCQPAVCTSGATYQGPGDIVSGATAWYGLRSYNAAYATGSNNAINVRRASDNSTSNIVILSNGNLDTATAASFAGTDATASCTVTGTSATCTGASATIHVNDPVTGTGITNPCVVTATNGSTTATISIAGTSTSCGTIAVAATLTFQVALLIPEVYDQSGNTNHVTQGTAGSQPTLTFSCTGSIPCSIFNGSKSVTGSIPSLAQPHSYSLLALVTSTAQQNVLSTFSSGSQSEVGLGHGAGVAAFLYCGSFLNANGSVSINAEVEAVCNGASSVVYFNGTAITGAGGSGSTSTTATLGADNGGASKLTGNLYESGVWPVGFSSANEKSLCQNKSSYYSMSLTCN